MPKPKNVDFAKQFGISPGQVTDILRNRPEFVSSKIEKSAFLESAKVEALIIWIEKALEYNITITGSLVQQKF